MFDETARRRFAAMAGPVARTLAARGVTPNQVTAVGLLLALAAAGAIAAGYGWAGLGLWLVSRVADGPDGVLARAAEAGLAPGKR